MCDQEVKLIGTLVVWVPDSHLLELDREIDEQADQVLPSLLDFVPEEWGLPPFDNEDAAKDA